MNSTFVGGALSLLRSKRGSSAFLCGRWLHILEAMNPFVAFWVLMEIPNVFFYKSEKMSRFDTWITFKMRKKI